MQWTCTTVHQGHGRRLSSAWHDAVSKLHLLETWPSSRGVIQDSWGVMEVMCFDGLRGGCGSGGCVGVLLVFLLRALAVS
jgi:hypothetical protein